LRRAVVFLIAAAVAWGCRDADVNAIASKCDASLRQRAEEMTRGGEAGAIEVLGKAARPLDDSHRRKLTDAGAEVGQVTNELFTAPVNLFVSLDWGSASDLELTISNADGIFVREVDTASHPESCRLDGLAAGTYTVRVGSFTNASTGYTLTIGER
jgi:hypothetical protein